MNAIDKKRMNKIYSKIDTIAKKGKLGFIEYKQYIDTIVNDSQFYILQYVLERKYKIDSVDLSLLEIKGDKIYNLIRLQTNSKFQENLTKLYDSYNTYQLGINVYNKSNPLNKIGEIFEESNTDIREPGKDILNAVKYGMTGGTYSLIGSIVLDDTTIEPLEKYRLALQYLTH